MRGETLRSLEFHGNPKHGEIVIETGESPRFVAPTHKFEVTFTGSPIFTFRWRAVDDVNAIQSVVWPADRVAVLDQVEVGWWLNEDAWEEALAARAQLPPGPSAAPPRDRWGRFLGWHLRVGVELRLTLRGQ